uniref:Uncharacterized protein n=1 Tax=Arundo donax TaxID=35708 RepID=A0A0A9AJ63_ARUDO
MGGELRLGVVPRGLAAGSRDRRRVAAVGMGSWSWNQGK